MAFSLDDYVDVAERIVKFYEAHPEGSLTTERVELMETQAGQFVVVHAKAWRSPDDPFPGDGVAWETLPGKTPYTKDSEVMNAQTAAWGRAIVACGILASKKIASRQEVQARQGDGASNGSNGPQKPAQSLPELYVDCLRLAIHSRDRTEAYPDPDEWAAVLAAANTKDQKMVLVEQLEAVARDLGLDPSLIQERWQAARVKAGT